ncbi:hypothetical protein AQUCO_01900081v1 [Aquilegia coerulea]|uniref:DUF295 domain-containing protein n=1 Tax=Aquilegia coerulea TaxID=218851 RepID=A0A2G5DIU2_AQUCA|nr:hypothetical protein AQUCO_01900081v1 [Aquilegia coerulea]
MNEFMKTKNIFYYLRRRFVKVFWNNNSPDVLEYNNSSPDVFELGDRDVNWIDLPDNLLCLIFDKLVDIHDCVRFGTVCHSWRSIYIENRVNLPHDCVLLMVPTQLNPEDDEREHRSFYSLSDKKVYDFKVPLPHNRFCFGSSNGWVITYSKVNFEIHMLNPFLELNNEIMLPPMPDFEPDLGLFEATGLEIFNRVDSGSPVYKAVVAVNSISNPDYVVMVSHGQLRRLSFCICSNRFWTQLDSRFRLIDDIICHNDKFYALNCYGQVYAIDVNHPTPRISQIAPNHELSGKKYLVESTGFMFQVLRDVRSCRYDYYTVGFTVLKLDRVRWRWDEVKNLGGRMFFLGDNCSLSLSVSDLPGCKPNCIYFTDDYIYRYPRPNVGPLDMGVFNLEDGRIEPHYPTESKMIFPNPVFICTAMR